MRKDVLKVTSLPEIRMFGGYYILSLNFDICDVEGLQMVMRRLTAMQFSKLFAYARLIALFNGTRNVCRGFSGLEER